MDKTSGKRHRRTLSALLTALLLLLGSAACGQEETDSALDIYRERMESFYHRVQAIDRAIDAIDPAREDAADTLLAQLDQLDELFAEMAEVEVPEEFSGMGDLPAEAADYMDKAVAAYHDAYEGDFDEDAEADASQYYERANVRIRYMLGILHGDTIVEEAGDGE